MRSLGSVTAVVVAAMLAAGACGGDDPERPTRPAEAAGPTTTVTTDAAPAPVPTSEGPSTSTPPPEPVVTAGPGPTAPPPPPTLAPPTTATSLAPAPAIVDIAYRVERRATDEATAGFEDVVRATLVDPRGWRRASFRFVTPDDAPYLIVLAEGDEVDRLCRPYDTYGKYSCQNGPVVAINADRWRSATPKWTGDLDSYRQMLVNHEVGHLLGMKHPRPQCARPGEPAPIMNQQSTELNGCLPNPWPLDDEIAVAARHDRKLAPGPGE